MLHGGAGEPQRKVEAVVAGASAEIGRSVVVCPGAAAAVREETARAGLRCGDGGPRGRGAVPGAGEQLWTYGLLVAVGAIGTLALFGINEGAFLILAYHLFGI
ncbi:hypothetical protein NDU88_003089 [Pleurodeles waltl]|uniref:Uncharacterized protein n=1 Tax=Pleurodeles waltl TaxID=8319 RepID=A0AAV7UCS5_PLEWA|nr:hypothetical protein NDU88_003089 [Pleurodeles waltl]